MKHYLPHLLAIACFGLKTPLFAADKPLEFPPQPPVRILTPEEELKKFQLPAGYSLELVVSDPIIKEPVAAVFDGNGRMYVAEMRSYMQDIDGKDEHTPVGRVSRHWSSKHNGVYDQHSVFIDKLVLPRMILPLADGVLVNETDSNDIYLYRDTNGDGVADKKELWFAGGPRGGNLEHQQSGLIWCLDNWLYSTYNSYRLRWTGTNVLKEATAPNGGQWGLCQDNYGKPWFVNAGGERGPLNFQVPIVYGDFNVKDQLAEGYMEVWPLVGLADVQGGPARYRPEDRTLNHFTATCGEDIFRGDRLPADLRGDLLFSEPVGRLIRRTNIDVKDGLTYLRNAYNKSEFIRSTDPNFRAVNLVTAPDGTLYIVDMYRGIIQEGNWVREGSYLRNVVQQYSLDKSFGHGRIWRLVHKDFKPGPQPDMLDEKPAQLVAHLEHPNGWWRDNAQKLIILRGDKSVAPALETMARTSRNPLARIHALWTLEGLGALKASLIREKMKDADPQVRVAAIRASETLLKNGELSLVSDVEGLIKDRDANVAIQVMLTSHLLKWTNATALIRTAVVNTNSPLGVKEIGTQLLVPKVSYGKEFTAAEKKLLERGETIYKELCFACHGPDGKGMPVDGKPGMTIAPPLAGSRTVIGHHDGVINVVLKGLIGPVNGIKYDALMVPMESNDDEWIAAAISYVRNNFGNHAAPITPKDVAMVRAKARPRTEPWTAEELHRLIPQPLPNRSQWKLSASHNAKNVSRAIDGDINTRYETGTPQKPGMWFEIELPQETTITGLELDAAKSAGDYPRGYKVEVSADGQSWGKPVAQGKGNGALTEILFTPVKAKFIRITQTGSVNGLFWSIHELEVLKPAEQTEIKATVAKGPAKPSFE